MASFGRTFHVEHTEVDDLVGVMYDVSSSFRISYFVFRFSFFVFRFWLLVSY